MSGKTAKQNRNTEKEKQEEYMKRRDAMVADLKTISRKYMIDISPVIQWQPQGARPVLAFTDMSEHYGQIALDKKLAKAKENKEEAESIVENPEGAGKLEV